MALPERNLVHARSQVLQDLIRHGVLTDLPVLTRNIWPDN